MLGPADQHSISGEDGVEDDVPMTLLAVNQGYWLYRGVDLLNDVLFGQGAYPFKVRCYVFTSIFELNKFVGGSISVASLWRITPGIIDRLRDEKLLIEIFSPDG
jgi:hypothetical protein